MRRVGVDRRASLAAGAPVLFLCLYYTRVDTWQWHFLNSYMRITLRCLQASEADEMHVEFKMLKILKRWRIAKKTIKKTISFFDIVYGRYLWRFRHTSLFTRIGPLGISLAKDAKLDHLIYLEFFGDMQPTTNLQFSGRADKILGFSEKNTR